MRLTNARIVTPNNVIEAGHIIIKGNRIDTIGEGFITDAYNCQGATLFPGFIDMHVHGTNNHDFMDASEASIKVITQAVLEEGVTSLLATTMTASIPRLENVLSTLAHYKNHKGAKLQGIHLEGPFINPAYQGAQNAEYIMQGSIQAMKQLNQASNHTIKLITLAPEMQNDAFMKYVLDANITISMGHSNATYDDVLHAKALGVKRTTHCFNAMRGIHHRDIGLSGAALLFDDIGIELIADFHHVSAPAIKLAHKLKQNNIELITDSIRAKNMPEGSYDLGGQTVTLKDNTVKTDAGSLAGSVLSLNQAARNIKTTIDVSDIDLAKMLSSNQASTLKKDHELGKLLPGYIADITMVDRHFNVLMTIVDGDILYQRGKT